MSRADSIFAILVGIPFVGMAVAALMIPENWKATLPLFVGPLLLFGLWPVLGGVRAIRGLYTPERTPRHLLVARWWGRFHFAAIVIAMISVLIGQNRGSAIAFRVAGELATRINLGFLFGTAWILLHHATRSKNPVASRSAT